MRRSLPIVLAVGALSFSACGSDEPSTTATTIDGSATTAPSASTVPADTVPVDPDNCVDVAAGFAEVDFPEGEIPSAVRPCELPTELTVNVLREGTGHEAAVGDTIIVDYSGIRSVDGTLFDDSYSRGTPFEFALGTGRVIAGWDQGLLGAQAGSLIRLDIPTELAYADTPRGDVIQPGDALSYMVEVLATFAPATEADAPLTLVVETSEGATEVTSVDVKVGDGALAQEGQTALLHLMIVRGDNRVVLEETWSGGQPAPLVLTPAETLTGVARGVQGMRVGGMRVITMPAADAFGQEGNSGIGLPADTDVIVVAELVGLYGQPTPGAPGTTVPNVVALTTPPTTTTTTTTAVSTVPASGTPGTSTPATTTPATTSTTTTA